MMLGIATLLSLSALDVRWTAPAGCSLPDLAELTAGTNGSAVVRITNGAPRRWGVDLTFLKPFQGTRHLDVTSCDDANRAARALLVLGLRGSEAFLEEDVSAPPAPPPPTQSAPQLSAVPIEVTRAGPVMSGGVRTGALANVLGLPATTPRFWVSGVLRVGSLELELAVRAGVPGVWPGGPTSTSSVAVWPTLGAELAGCYGPRLGRFRPAACALVVAERWEVRGAGVSDPRTGLGALVGVGARAHLAFSLGAGFEVGTRMALLGNVRRPVAEFDDVASLSAGPISFEAGGWLGFCP